jgi:hypothetical protein
MRLVSFLLEPVVGLGWERIQTQVAISRCLVLYWEVRMDQLNGMIKVASHSKVLACMPVTPTRVCKQTKRMVFAMKEEKRVTTRRVGDMICVVLLIESSICRRQP